MFIHADHQAMLDHYESSDLSLFEISQDIVENFLGYCDLKLELLRRDDDDDDSIEVEGATLKYFLSGLNTEPIILPEHVLAAEINNFISEQVRAIIISEHIREKNTIINKKNSNQGKNISDDHIDDIKNMPLEKYYEKDWAREKNDDAEINLLESAMLDSLKQVFKLMESIEENMPWMLDFNNTIVESRHKTLVINYLDQLIKVMNRMSNNMPDLLLSKIKSNHNLLKSIKEQVIAEFRSDLQLINEKHTPLVDAKLSRKERRELKKAAYIAGRSASAQLVKVETVDKPKDVEVKVAESYEETSEDIAAELEEIGLIKLDLPWLSKDEKLLVEVMKGREQDVYVVKALGQKLKKISQEVRDGLPKNTKGEDKIDQKIKQIVKRISEGIMPYENTNSVKSLSTDSKDLSDLYQDENIWYTFDVSPNAPRIYFTVHETPEELKKHSEKDSKLVIILAEADKARQLDTLTILTTLSSTSLKARGAGSV